MLALRAVPFTVALVAGVLVAGGVVGTLFSSAAGSALAGSLAYGPDALVDRRPQAFLTGALLAPGPARYVILVALLAGSVGYLERRVGALRAAAVLIGVHLVATVGAAAILLGAQAAGSSWAPRAAGSVGLGLSAGAIGALAAGTALMHPLMRSRMRWAVGGFVVIMLLRSGSLVDLERTIGFGTGLALGPLVAAHRRSAPAAGGTGTADRAGTAGVGGAVGEDEPVDVVGTGRPPRLVRIRGAVALLLVLVPLTSAVLAVAPGVGGILGQVDVVHHHRLLAGLVQVAIGVVIAKAVRRGLPGGWWAAVVFCAVPLGGAMIPLVMQRVDIRPMFGDIVCWASILAVLAVCRRCWPLRLPAGTFRRHLLRLAIATVAFATLWWVALVVAGPALGIEPARRLPEVLRRTVFGGEAHGAARWVQFAVGMSGWIWACVLVVLLLPVLHRARPVRQRRTSGCDPMAEMLQRHGGGSLGWQRTWPGQSSWTNRTGDVAIGYRPVSGVAIVLGDPVGPAELWPAAVVEFRRFCLYAGWTVCWYAVTEEFRTRCGDDWRTLQIGEDAVISLAGLEFRGKAWQDVRTARNHAARDGIEMRSVTMADMPTGLQEQILAVSRGWADGKPLPEMGFTLGTVEHARDPQMRMHIAVDGAGIVHGVTTWLPVHRDGAVIGWTLDVMRRRIGGFRPVIEFLIAESALAFQAQGYQTVSLSVAPLARCAATAAGTRLERVLDRFSRIVEPCYGFRSLLEFKRKFHPDFSPVYLGYADELDLTEISLAIGKAYLPHLTPRQALRVVRALCRGRRESAVAAR